jgi:protein gp37
MSEGTNIAWCDDTINFWRGCDKVSLGCKNCYIVTTPIFRFSKMTHGDDRVWSKGAVDLAFRLNRRPWICPMCGHSMATGESQGYAGCPVRDAEGKIVGSVMHAAQHRRRRIFSLSLGDWLDRHKSVTVEMRAEMLHTIWKCSDVTWILVSKRLEHWRACLQEILDWQSATGDSLMEEAFFLWIESWLDGASPLRVWLLASVENQTMADERIPQLLSIPALARGLSLEPLLGPVVLPPLYLHLFDWLVIGGESGKAARECNVDWIRALVKRGQAAHVATFVKQLGAFPVAPQNQFWAGPTFRAGCPDYNLVELQHKKGEDMSEFPDDLRVREWPEPVPS